MYQKNNMIELFISYHTTAYIIVYIIYHTTVYKSLYIMYIQLLKKSIKASFKFENNSKQNSTFHLVCKIY